MTLADPIRFWGAVLDLDKRDGVGEDVDSVQYANPVTMNFVLSGIAFEQVVSDSLHHGVPDVAVPLLGNPV